MLQTSIKRDGIEIRPSLDQALSMLEGIELAGVSGEVKARYIEGERKKLLLGEKEAWRV